MCNIFKLPDRIQCIDKMPSNITCYNQLSDITNNLHNIPFKESHLSSNDDVDIICYSGLISFGLEFHNKGFFHGYLALHATEILVPTAMSFLPKYTFLTDLFAKAIGMYSTELWNITVSYKYLSLS